MQFEINEHNLAPYREQLTVSREMGADHMQIKIDEMREFINTAIHPAMERNLLKQNKLNAPFVKFVDYMVNITGYGGSLIFLAGFTYLNKFSAGSPSDITDKYICLAMSLGKVTFATLYNIFSHIQIRDLKCELAEMDEFRDELKKLLGEFSNLKTRQ